MPENFRRAGALRERLHCQRRQDADDGWGQVTPGAGEFATEFTVSASLRPLRGGEAVQAARLSGRQPYVCAVRASAQTRQINTSWRLVDARDDRRVLSVTSPVADPTGRNAWLEFLVVDGLPT